MSEQVQQEGGRRGDGTARARPGPRRLLAIGAAGVAVLLLAAAVALVAGKDVLVREVLEARLHRSVSFARLTFGRSADGLRLSFTDLHVGQPASFGPGDLAQAGRMELSVRLAPLLTGKLVAPEVLIVAPDLHLRRRGRGDDNWTFGHGGGASSLLSGTRRLEIRDGRVRMDDTALDLHLDAVVSHATPGPELPLRLEGGGVLKGQPFRVTAAGGPLNGRRRGSPHRIDVALTDALTHLRLQGTSRAPFDFRGLDAEVAADGPNLADLTYLFELTVPNSPAFRLTAHVHRAGRLFETTRLVARVGDSDVEGRIVSDHKAHREITAVFRSRRLTARDLKVLLASPPPHAVARDTPGVSGKGLTPPGFVFSRAPVSLRRLGGVDASLDYAAASVTGFGPPLSDARVKLTLAGGRLRFAPLSFATVGGTVRADYALDTTAARPSASLDVRVRGLQVARLKGGSVGGLLDADLDLRGSGASLAAQAAAAGGRADVRVRGGSLPKLKAAALGGDVFGLVAGALQPGARTPLRCAAADFTVRAGVAEATRLTVATAEGTASGGGRIDLARERLDLSLKAAPGGAGLIRLRTPITITGPLARPKVSASLASARPSLPGVGAVLRRLVGRPPPPAPPPASC